MAKFDKSVLEKYGITGTTEVLYNPSYEVLFNEETKEGLKGYEVGQETELGAINVMTGIYTGRSPKDKFIVDDETSHDTVWWDSEEYHNDNHRATKEAWAQAFVCSRWLLRYSQGYTHEDSLHHGGCLAGSFRNKYVHSSKERG